MSDGTGPPGTTLFLFSSELERAAAILDDALPEGTVAEIAGVGPIDAALGAADAIARHQPSRAIFLGTAGGYPASRIGSEWMVVAGEVVLLSGDVVEGAMRLPDLVCSRLQCDPALTRRLAGSELPVVRVGCTLGITENNSLATAIGVKGEVDVETMEVFGVARAAEREGVPFASVLGITNVVGSEGGAGWRANFRTMMRRAWEHTVEQIAADNREGIESTQGA